MSTITTRSGKGSPLTNNEVDANFTNLNNDKLEISAGTATIYLGQSSGTAEATSLASVFDGTSSFGTATATLQNSTFRNGNLRGVVGTEYLQFSPATKTDPLRFILGNGGYVFYDVNTSNTFYPSESGNAGSNVYRFTLPSLDGTAGQTLQTDGNGVLSFADSGGVTTGKAIAMAIVFG